MIFVFRNLLEHDISNLYSQYSFVFTFTNIFLTIREEQTSLLNHCISTQRRPHARPRAMPRAVFSFKNNNPFYYKQSSAVKTIATKFKQWLRASTYCLGDRSAYVTLLILLFDLRYLHLDLFQFFYMYPSLHVQFFLHVFQGRNAPPPAPVLEDSVRNLTYLETIWLLHAMHLGRIIVQ